MRKLLGCFIILIIMTTSQMLAGTVYYVDATNGNDSNDGSSPENAWKTINKVNNSPFFPGDFILFKRGEIWRGELRPSSSGINGNPITYGAYGSGDKPKIFRSVAKNNPEDWINESGNLWYSNTGVVMNLIMDSENSISKMVQNKSDLDTQGEAWMDFSNDRIYLYSTTNPAAYYNRDIECAYNEYCIYVNDKSYIAIENFDCRYAVNKGIRIKKRNPATTTVTVDNCNFRWIGNNLSGINHWGGDAIIVEDMPGCVISNNNFNYVFEAVNVDGSIEGGFSILIENNIVAHTIGDDGDADGFVFAEGDYNGSIVQNNDVSSYGDDGIDCYKSSNVLVRWNSFHDPIGNREGNGIKMGFPGSSGTQAIGNHIYNLNTTGNNYGIVTNLSDTGIIAYNIIHNVKYGIVVQSLGSSGENNNYQVYNNVCYNCSNYAIYIGSGISEGNKLIVTVQNNICDGEGNNQDFRCGSYSEITGGYNCLINGSSVSGSGNYSGSEYDFYETDPLFVNPNYGNFFLQSNSPCIDTGINVGFIEDFAGNTVPYGYGVDIGAYEYTGENPPLDANVDASPASGVTPLTVNFTGNATGGTSPYSFSWDFGDGGYSTEQNPSYTYYSEGNYTVILTVTDNEGSQNSDSVTIMVTAPLTPVVASGSASPTSGDYPLTVNFTGNATGGTPPYSYYWSFGDGQSSDQQNPSHTYNTPGNYTVTLTVTDNISGQDSDSLLITVTSPATPLVASSSASPNSGDYPLTVYFTGDATGGIPPYTYYWNFGDGQSSTQQNPSHTYNSAGNYSAILTVRDSNNSQDSDSLTISVTAPPPPPLVASCIASPTSGDVPFTVYFTGSASGGTPPYSFSWNFGDGGNSTEQNPSHIYNAAGNYTATLTVTDSQSIQDNVSLTITATLSPAQAYLSCSPANLFFGASVSGAQPSNQYLRIINAGDGTMNWNVQESTAWLSCSPLSGTNRGQVTVSVNATGLSPGTYDAIITASSPQAYNSPQLIEVNLRVYEAGIDIPDGNPLSERDSVVGLTLNDIKARRAGIKKNSDPNNPTEAIESGGLVTVGNTLIADNSTEKGNLERPDELNTPYQKDETGALTIGLKEILTGLKPRSSIDIDTEEDRIAIDQAKRPASIKQKSQIENERESTNIKRVQIEEMEPLRIVFTSSLKENISFIGWGEDEQTALPSGSTLDTVKGEFSWVPPFGSTGKYVFHFAVTDGVHRSQPLRIEVDVTPKSHYQDIAQQ